MADDTTTRPNARKTREGIVTSNFTTGSISTGLAVRTAFRIAFRPAVLNAASELSTGWSLPKNTSTATSWMR